VRDGQHPRRDAILDSYRIALKRLDHK
jgi:hypothetical protein